MSADEIKGLAELLSDNGDYSVCKLYDGGVWVESIGHCVDIRSALLAYAAMVERCENLLKDYDLYGLVSDANKQKCDLLRKHVNYILKGAINGTKH